MNFFNIAFIVTLVLFSGCAQKKEPKIIKATPKPVKKFYPLTSSIINGTESLSKSDFYGLQVYTFNEIILQKSLVKKTTKVDKGILVYDKKSDLKQIIIDSNTPCVIVDIDDMNELITVEFEDGIQLTFSTSKEICNDNKGRYFLAADSWVGDVGLLTVNGIKYKAVGTSGSSCLRINKKFLKNTNSDIKHLKGKWIVQRDLNITNN